MHELYLSEFSGNYKLNISKIFLDLGVQWAAKPVSGSWVPGGGIPAKVRGMPVPWPSAGAPILAPLCLESGSR